MISLELQRDGGDDLLQLAAAGARQRVAIGRIARGKGLDEALHPDGEVGNGRVQTAERAERPGLLDRLFDPDAVDQVVAGRESRWVHHIAAPRRVGQAERLQQALADHVLVRVGADVGDHLAEQREADVRVVEGHAGHACMRLRRGHELEVLRGWHRLEAVGPRVILRIAGAHRQQIAQRRGRAVGRRQRQFLQLRDVVGDRVVEAQAALVTQQQDHRRDEALCHRRDPERAVGGGPVARAHVQLAETHRVHQLAVGDDAPRESRCALRREPLGEERLHLGDARGVDLAHAGVQRRARRSLPIRPSAFAPSVVFSAVKASSIRAMGRSCMAGMVRVPAMRMASVSCAGGSGARCGQLPDP